MGASGELGVGLLANAVMKEKDESSEERGIPAVGGGEKGDETEGFGKVDGVVDVADAGAVKPRDGGEMITCSSDSSPCPRSEKHEPAEAEANLASLLLAKEPFSIEQIVPAMEDIDFGYFEKVLLGNPEVLHLGAGKYVIPNPSLVKLIFELILAEEGYRGWKERSLESERQL
ncbi:BnaC06g41470D [Brassica napus]|uniref:BnaC06g41470D protein n=1 Tax=Brassica napus TaxID=3708 RepID=A0A078JA49_BRANA|nr:BnaC06g41470D [Brassica napus]